MFSAVFVFQVFRLFKVPNKIWKNYIKISVNEPSGRTKRWKGGHHQGPRRVPGAAPPWAAPGGLLASLWVLSAPPSPIFTPRPETLGNRTLFRETLSVPQPPPFQDRGCVEKLLWHPAGRRHPLRETIHSHGRLPDVP